MARIPCRQVIVPRALSVLQENNNMQFVYTENAVSICDFGARNV